MRASTFPPRIRSLKDWCQFRVQLDYWFIRGISPTDSPPNLQVTMTEDTVSRSIDQASPGLRDLSITVGALLLVQDDTDLEDPRKPRTHVCRVQSPQRNLQLPDHSQSRPHRHPQSLRSRHILPRRIRPGRPAGHLLRRVRCPPRDRTRLRPQPHRSHLHRRVPGRSRSPQGEQLPWPSPSPRLSR